MFSNSGFTRTLCGGQWEALSSKRLGYSTNSLTSTGRLGCCSRGTFMAKPNLNPFSQATACDTCAVGRTTIVDNDDTSTECRFKTVPIPDCSYAWQDMPIPDGYPNHNRNCGIQQAVDTHTTQATIAKYGVIEDWDVSLVTDMREVFDPPNNRNFSLIVNHRIFNADISKWNVGNVTTMERST